MVVVKRITTSTPQHPVSVSVMVLWKWDEESGKFLPTGLGVGEKTWDEMQELLRKNLDLYLIDEPITFKINRIVHSLAHPEFHWDDGWVTVFPDGEMEYEWPYCPECERYDEELLEMLEAWHEDEQ